MHDSVLARGLGRPESYCVHEDRRPNDLRLRRQTKVPPIVGAGPISQQEHLIGAKREASLPGRKRYAARIHTPAFAAISPLTLTLAPCLHTRSPATAATRLIRSLPFDRTPRCSRSAPNASPGRTATRSPLNQLYRPSGRRRASAGSRPKEPRTGSPALPGRLPLHDRANVRRSGKSSPSALRSDARYARRTSSSPRSWLPPQVKTGRSR